MPDLSQELTGLAGRILETLRRASKADPLGGQSGPSLSAWDLKMELKTSHTRLHLALGMLIARKEIRLETDGLTHKVLLARQQPAEQPAADLPGPQTAAPTAS